MGCLSLLFIYFFLLNDCKQMKHCLPLELTFECGKIQYHIIEVIVIINIFLSFERESQQSGMQHWHFHKVVI